MNFVKKLFAVLLAVTISVSCFALFSSAEAPKLSLDDLDAVFEHHTLKDQVYSNEFYDDKAEGEYATFNLNKEFDDGLAKKFYNFARSKKAVNVDVVSDGNTNKVLKIKGTGTTSITTTTDAAANYYLSKSTNFTSKLVVSFDVKVHDENKDGCNITINLDNKENQSRKDFFAFDLSDSGNPVFKYYGGYNSGEESTGSCIMEGLTPEFDKWYTVNAVFNCDDNNFVIDVFERDNPQNKATSGSVMFAAENVDDGINYVKVAVRAIKADSATEIYMDNLAMYSGTVIRDIRNPQDEINQFIVGVDEIASSSSISTEKRVEIGNFYQKLFFDEEFGMLYTPDTGSAKYDEVMEIKANAKKYVNRSFAEALAINTEKFTNNTVTGYYNLVELFEATVAYDAHFSDNEAELLLLEGVDENGENGNVKAADILSAKQVYDNMSAEIERVKQHSIRFVNLVAAFDYTSTDYEYIESFILAAADCSACDATFKYAEELGLDEDDDNYKYEYAALALEEYGNINLTLSEIKANAGIFMSAVIAMPDNPHKMMQGFGTLYSNYLKAGSVFIPDSANFGTVHESLDPATYPDVAGVSLESCIEKYLRIKAFIDPRAYEADEFISLVNSAATAAAYRNTLALFNEAALYLDTDVDNKSIEPEYPGVPAAIATYNALREKLAANVAAADAYKTAVNAINIEASYTELKASVEAALALKEAGAVVGIDGVKEANVKLLEAEAKVKALEGNSSTLKAAVNALKNAETLAERRELIFIANKAAAGAEDSISGVTAARAELEAAIAQFNADVAAANTGFFTAVKNAADVTSSTADSSNVYKMADIVNALLK